MEYTAIGARVELADRDLGQQATISTDRRVRAASIGRRRGTAAGSTTQVYGDQHGEGSNLEH